MAEPTTPNPKQNEQQPLPVPPVTDKQELAENEQQENLVQGAVTSKKKEPNSPAPEPAPKQRKAPFSTEEDEAEQEKTLQEIFNALYDLRKDLQSLGWGFVKKGFAAAFSDDDKAEAELAQQDDHAEKNKQSETEESSQKIEASDKDDAQNKDEDNTLDKKDNASFDKVGDEEPNAKMQQPEEQAYDELAKGSDKTNESEPAANANSDDIQVSAESSASSGPETPAIPNMTAMSSAPDDSAQTAQNYDVMAATTNGDADAAASTAVQGVSVEEVAEVAVVVAL